MDRTITSPEFDQAASAIDWWLTAGVDTLVEETPRDWLASNKQPVIPARGTHQSTTLMGPKAGTSTGEECGGPRVEVPASAGMTEAPALPADLPALRRVYETQPDLPFAGPGATRVLPSGDPASGLMMLADMPTSEDAAAGVIFSGECGMLFDRMLAAIGRDRQSIYLATLSCLAAPGGRLDAETAGKCGELARQHVKLAAPRRVLLLGEAATRVMTGLALPAARGRLHAIEVDGTRVNAVATYHPRYLLARPAAKAGAWSDLQLLVEDER